MANPSPSSRRLKDLAQSRNLDAFETAWLAAVAEHPENLDQFMDAISILETQGLFEKAGGYLSLLVPVYVDRNMNAHAEVVLRKMAAISPKERGIRYGFLQIFRRLYGTHPEFDTLLKHSGLEKDADIQAAVGRLEAFLTYRVGGYVEHPAGWGIGRITAVDSTTGTVTIDFERKHGHQVSMAVARNITEVLPDDDLRAMKFDRRDELLRLAETDPPALLKIAVKARGGTATAKEIKGSLGDDVIPVKDWSRWWGKARTKAKGDPYLRIGAGNNPTVELLRSSTTHADTARSNLVGMDDFESKVKYFRTIIADAEVHPEAARSVGDVARDLVGSVDDEPLSARLSFAILLEQAARLVPDLVIPPSLALGGLTSDPSAVITALPDLPITAHEKIVLARLKDRVGEAWPDWFEKVVLLGRGETSEAAAKALLEAGAYDRVTRLVLVDILEKYRDRPEAFLWFARLVAGGKVPKGIPNPGLAIIVEKTALLHSWLHSRNVMKPDPAIKRTQKTIQNMLSARRGEIVGEAVKTATDAAEAQNVYSVVRNRTFPEDVRDILVAAALRARPDMARTETPADTDMVDPDALYVTAESYKRKEAEYQKLLNVDIPENAREIGKAASYGDLSENFEWSSAIARRDQLVHKAEALRVDLERARIIDDDMFNPECGSIGARIRVLNKTTGQPEAYTILGPWDLDAGRSVISYQSPVGRGLLGKKAGESVKIDLPQGNVEYEVVGIEKDEAAKAG